MAGNIKGITLEIDGNVQGLDKALKQVNKELKGSQNELKQVEKALKLDPKNTELLAQKQKLLNDVFEQNKTKLKSLKDAKKQADEAMKNGTEVNEQEYRKLLIEIAKTEAEVRDLNAEMIKPSKIDFGAIGAKIKSGLGEAAKAAAKAFAAASVAIGAALVGIGKQAVEAYASFEQLTGGIDTLFKESSDKVKQYANEAFKTSGMSANEYMDTVTSFSAAMINSLGGDTQKAADYSNQAVVDMSDNANKMGTSMESIVNTYQSLAKGNYTMLDNLKLGYGGTKTEMERLLADAEKLTGQKYDVSNFADVTQAIHAIQVEMGIAGATAEEAATTIEGSIKMTKSAYENFIASLGTGDVEMIQQNVQLMIEAAMTAFNNLMPVIQSVIDGLLSSIGTIVSDTLPQLLNTIVPTILSLLPEISQSALDLLMAVVQTLITNLPMIIDAAVQIVQSLASGLAGQLPTLIPQAVEMVITIVTGLLDNVDLLVDSAISLIEGLTVGIANAMPILIEKAPEIIIKFNIALIKAIPKLLEAAFKIIDTINSGIAQGFAKIVEIGVNIVKGIWGGISKSAQWLWGKIKEWCGSILNGVKAFFGIESPSKVFREQVGRMLPKGMALGIQDGQTEVEKALNELNGSVISIEQGFADEQKKIYDAMSKDFSSYVDNVANKFDELGEAQKNWTSKLRDGISLTSEYTYQKTDGGGYRYSKGGVTVKGTKLADLSQTITDTKNWNAKVQSLKALLPAEMFSEIASGNVQDITSFMSAFFSASASEQQKFINDWEELQKVTNEASKAIYSEEVQQTRDEFISAFSQTPQEFFGIGEEAATQFGSAFMEKLSDVLKGMKISVNKTANSILPSEQRQIVINQNISGYAQSPYEVAKETSLMFRRLEKGLAM